jgi:ABC-type lipoprotein release transport system permease subunit
MKDRLLLFTELAWRNLWRNRRRTLITFVAISVGVWSMLVLAALMQAWGASAFDAAVRTLTGHGQIHAAGYLDDPTVDHRFRPPQDLIDRLESNDVRAWATRVRVPAFLQTERKNAPVTLVGIDADAERGLSFIPEAVNEGSYLSGAGSSGLLLGRRLAERMGTGLGKRVVVLSQSAAGEIAERGFEVAGIFDAEQEETETGFVFVPEPTAQSMLGMSDEVSEIALTVADIERLPTVLDSLRQAGPALDVASWSEIEPFTKAILDISDGTIALWTVIMFIMVAFGLVNTLLMAVLERTREFGLVQALGLRPRLLLLQILIESAFLIGLGVIVGVVAGLATLLGLHGGLDLSAVAQGGAVLGIGRTLYPEIDGPLTVEIALFVWLMGVVTGLYPAWRAAKDVPVATINKAY